MKVNANGEIKLGQNETRLGEFVVSKENAHYKVQTISGNWSMSIGENTAMYNMIKMSLGANETKLLHGWITVMYNVSLVVPDPELLTAINDVSNECFLRHKELYGVKEVSDEEDKKIVEEMKEERDMIDRMRN